MSNPCELSSPRATPLRPRTATAGDHSPSLSPAPRCPPTGEARASLFGTHSPAAGSPGAGHVESSPPPRGPLFTAAAGGTGGSAGKPARAAPPRSQESWWQDRMDTSAPQGLTPSMRRAGSRSESHARRGHRSGRGSWAGGCGPTSATAAVSGNSPDEERRRSQRAKQVSFGYVTDGYRNMIRLVEHDPVLRSGGLLPLAPPDISRGSKRSWDIQLRKWRRALHMFDHVFIDGVDDEAGRAAVEEQQRLQWVSAAFTTVVGEGQGATEALRITTQGRVRVSMQALLDARRSPAVPVKIPVEDDLHCILRADECFESVRAVVPQTASSLTKGTDISPLEAGIKIHIAPSAAVLQKQQEMLERQRQTLALQRQQQAEAAAREQQQQQQQQREASLRRAAVGGGGGVAPVQAHVDLGLLSASVSPARPVPAGVAGHGWDLRGGCHVAAPHARLGGLPPADPAVSGSRAGGPPVLSGAAPPPPPLPLPCLATTAPAVAGWPGADPSPSPPRRAGVGFDGNPHYAPVPHPNLFDTAGTSPAAAAATAAAMTSILCNPLHPCLHPAAMTTVGAAPPFPPHDPTMGWSMPPFPPFPGAHPRTAWTGGPAPWLPPSLPPGHPLAGWAAVGGGEGGSHPPPRARPPARPGSAAVPRYVSRLPADPTEERLGQRAFAAQRPREEPTGSGRDGGGETVRGGRSSVGGSPQRRLFAGADEEASAMAGAAGEGR